MIPACRGGWCAAKRDKCARYRPGRIEQSVLDRVCSAKDTESFIPIYPAPQPAQEHKEAAWPA